MSEAPARATRDQVRLLMALQRPRERVEQGLLLVEGATLLQEALEAGLEPRLVASTAERSRRHAEVLDAAEGAGAARVLLDARQAGRVGATDSGPGLVAAVTRPPPWDRRVPPTGPALALALCGLQDPGNTGTLLRSARAFGALAALVAPGGADPTGPKVVRASAGAAFHLPVDPALDLQALPAWAAAHELVLCVARPPATPGEGSVPLPPRCVLVLGHETRGVPAWPGAREVCVAQAPGLDSLNVAMAGSILMARWYDEQAPRGAP